MDQTPRRGLLAHLVSSATGAANDNLFRQVVAVELFALGAASFPHDKLHADQRGDLLVALAGMAFVLPFVLLAPLAGALGDRLPRRSLVLGLRALEIPLVLLGVWGFSQGWATLMYLALGGLALQSALFAPVKLSIMPDLVRSDRLSSANAALQAVTIVAILAGTAAAMVCGHETLSKTPFSGIGPAGALAAIGLLLAIIGVIAAWRLPPMPAADPNARLRIGGFVNLWRELATAPGVLAPALGLAAFWGLAAAAQTLVVASGERAYALGHDHSWKVQVSLAGGIIVGAVTAPLLAIRGYPAGLPVIGAGIAAFSLVMGAGTAWQDAQWLFANPEAGPHSWHAYGFWLFLTGVGAGLWEIPLQTLVQERAPAARRSQVMAAAGVLGSLTMLLAQGLAVVLIQVFETPGPRVLATLGWITAAGVALCAWHWRTQILGWFLMRLVRVLYRIEVTGGEDFPREGGCLVVCNHVSYADGLILSAVLPRAARYLVYHTYVNAPIVGHVLRAGGAIAVADGNQRQALVAAIDAAVAAAKAGEIVVIFPEGKLSRSGHMDVFRSGMERIAQRAGVPVVPMHLTGVWGLRASRAPEKSWPLPWRRVGLRIGPVTPSTTSAPEARHHVNHLSYEHAQARSDRDGRTLGTALLRQAKKHPRHVAVHDAGGTVSTLQLTALAMVLRHHLGLAGDERTVGVLLPPGRAGAIVNAALAIDGRTAVNLNHTVGAGQLEQLCSLAKIRTVITAGLYLRRIGEPALPGRVIQVDQLLPTITKMSVMLAMARILTLPTRWLARGRPDDVAAIIFSSGSTGIPKGVELTHRQILANCDSVAQALHLVPGQDVVLSPLPLFHSFGLVPGLWLGLVLGLRVAAQPDPMDGAALGKLAQAAGASFLISTPTFVRGYLRRIDAEQFKTMRFAVVGAERCPAELKAQFKEKYGADLLEGYGCTELSPVVAVNLPLVERDGVREVRAKDGSVGRALPGIHVFAVHPETFAPLGVNEEGLLIVKSPSRMRGYLDRPELTEKAFLHGGYNTGDIGKVDADGFVFITGRLARFAKIGGEMVPLDNVEAAIQGAVGEAFEIAVAAVADPQRGERLVVLAAGDPKVVIGALEHLKDLPALFRPRSGDIRAVEAIPKLGTGKRDLGAIKKLAAEVSAKA